MARYKYDVVVIGAGPNGLALASYLSRAGAKVIVLERNFETGGGLATEDLTIPGLIHNSHAVYHLMVDYAPPLQDFTLEKDYNIRYVYPDLQFAMPLSDGRCICLYRDVEKTCQSLAKFSKKDADRWRDISRKSREYMDTFLAPATYVAALPLLEQAAKFEQSDFGRELMAYSEKSPKEIVDELFENEHVKALMAYAICYWGLEYERGGLGYLALLLLNRITNYRLCIGGSHRLSSALTRVIMKSGGQLRTSIIIKKILVENGTAVGVEIDDGTIYEAEKAVVSSIDPHQTFLKLIDRKEFGKDFLEKVEGWMWEKWSYVTIHLALEGKPDFAAAASNPDVNGACVYVLGYETVDDLLRHFTAMEKGELLKSAGFNCCFPSVHDPSQAAPGRWTGLISQMAPYRLKDGGADKWYDQKLRDEITQDCLATLERYAPGIKKNVMWYFAGTPIDIVNKLPNMVQGSIKQGAYHPLQMGYNRPNDECSNHRTPIKNLYLCGASSHSGGMVTFGPGYIAANRIAEDADIKKWWSEPDYVTRAHQKGLL